MAKGTIKKIVSDRGFGFIKQEDDGDVFFHRSAVQEPSFETLHEGQEVDYDVEKDPRGRGMRAINVRAA